MTSRRFWDFLACLILYLASLSWVFIVCCSIYFSIYVNKLLLENLPKEQNWKHNWNLICLNLIVLFYKKKLVLFYPIMKVSLEAQLCEMFVSQDEQTKGDKKKENFQIYFTNKFTTREQRKVYLNRFLVFRKFYS